MKRLEEQARAAAAGGSGGGAAEDEAGAKADGGPTDELCIDAKHKGSIGRFLNHCCEPNLAIQNVRSNDHCGAPADSVGSTCSRSMLSHQLVYLVVCRCWSGTQTYGCRASGSSLPRTSRPRPSSLSTCGGR